MTRTETPSPLVGVILEEQIELSLTEVCAACRVQTSQIIALVEEGVIEPATTAPPDQAPADWRFAGAALTRARRALRLQRDLDLDPSAAALVLELLDRIDALRAMTARDR